MFEKLKEGNMELFEKTTATIVTVSAKTDHVHAW